MFLRAKESNFALPRPSGHETEAKASGGPDAMGIVFDGLWKAEFSRGTILYLSLCPPASSDITL